MISVPAGLMAQDSWLSGASRLREG